MKRKILALCMILVLCSALFPPALAAPSFSDVPAGSWFEPGVITCAGEGIMVGTGEGRFSPDKKLSAAECLTLALRLYDLQRGGDGALETAPEDWGKIVLTLSDGTSFTRYGEQPNYPYVGFHYDHFDSIQAENQVRVYITAPGSTEEEQNSWVKAHEGKATLRVDGVDYPGIVDADVDLYSASPCLRFTADGNDPSVGVDACRDVKPGPDKWFRNSVYTAEVWGLSQEPGFDSLIALCYGSAGQEGMCDREWFALALSVAAGELEKKYSVERIPDLERHEYSEAIYRLYEAGILSGTDQIGTFSPRENLTRAEAAAMAARVLEEDQRLAAPPSVPSAYDVSVAELRNWFTYDKDSERTFDTDTCTVFVYDRGGAMHVGPGNITFIYKAGSQPGEGTYIGAENPCWWATYQRGVESVQLSEDKKSFTYTYLLERPVQDQAVVKEVMEAGIYTYTVDLFTGETVQSYAPLSYEGWAYILEYGRNYTLERRIEAPTCTVMLRWKPLKYEKSVKDYELWLCHKDPDAPEITQRLLLPSTAYVNVTGTFFAPTDRAPDSLELSEDGKTLTYIYHFDEALEDFHDAGTYIYTVDLVTGKLNVQLASPYEQALAEVLNTSEFRLSQQIETELCTIVAGMGKAANYDRAYLALVYKPGSLPGAGAKVWLPTIGGRSSYSSLLPDTLSVNEEGTVLTYTYHFDETLYDWKGTLTQKAGDHIYTVDLTTGEVSETHTLK